MFKQHLEMIGRNETPSKKAKFWQSYIRSLKGSDDIRAHDTPKATGNWRREYSPIIKSIYDEPSTAQERITGAGYRYLPVHRDTYGYSPRPIYSHHYQRPISSYDIRNYDAEKAWNEHLERMKQIERRYPSRYGLYLKDKPNGGVIVPLEYEPEDKPVSGPYYRGARATSVPPIPSRAGSVPPSPLGAFGGLSGLSGLGGLGGRGGRASSLGPNYSPLDSFLRLPIIRNPSWLPYNSLSNLLNHKMGAITRDPFWYDLADIRRSPSVARDFFR